MAPLVAMPLVLKDRPEPEFSALVTIKTSEMNQVLYFPYYTLSRIASPAYNFEQYFDKPQTT
jgi:hypothetical protein